jgi:DNA topoisomerase I
VQLLGQQKPGFVGKLSGASGERLQVRDGVTAEKVRNDLSAASFKVKAITRREQRRNATAPYTTSKLQQDATNVLHFTAKRTMQVAQGLYEGVDLGKDGGPVGLITYMRTDSVRVSDDAIAEARVEIERRYGKAYVPEKPNVFKTKKSAQDAHEAIRPASLELPPDLIRKHLKEEQYKLYKLIWDRFLASQMTPAVYDQTAVEVQGDVPGESAFHRVYELRATGRVLKFAGWLEQYGKGISPEGLAGEEDGDEAEKKAEGKAEAESDSAQLPPLSEGEALSRVEPPGVLAEQKFTQPPPRFNEGSLVRELEKRGIGRPSTYAEIISKVQARDYVEKMPGGAFKPSELGGLVVDGLVRSNLDFIDPGFTAKLEEELDEVEAGTLDRVALLKRFYVRFRKQLDESKKAKRWNPEPVDTGVECEVCHEGTMHKRWSKNGYFLGCGRYPKCKNTRNLAADGTEQPAARETIFVCEQCKTGKLLMKSGRFGDFLGCSNYPKCDFTRPVPLGLTCPKCKTGDIIEIKPKKRGGRTFWGCSNYASENSCDFKVWQRPVKQPCPKCNGSWVVLGGNKKAPQLVCVTEGCGNSWELAPEDVPAVEVLTPPESIFEEFPTPNLMSQQPDLEALSAKGKGGKNGKAADKADKAAKKARPSKGKAKGDGAEAAKAGASEAAKAAPKPAAKASARSDAKTPAKAASKDKGGKKGKRSPATEAGV